MAKRKKKLLKVTGPRLRITSKGVKIQAPRARIGGKAGINISRSGVSGSVRTKYGTANSKRGVTLRMPKGSKRRASSVSKKGGCCLPGCGVVVTALMLPAAVFCRLYR